jgi:hypothetical protein
MDNISLSVTFPIHWKQIKNLIFFPVSHVKDLFHLQDINIESRPNNEHGNHLAQWNMHLGLALWGDFILLKNLPCVDLHLVLHHLNGPVKGHSPPFELSNLIIARTKNTTIMMKTTFFFKCEIYVKKNMMKMK